MSASDDPTLTSAIERPVVCADPTRDKVRALVSTLTDRSPFLDSLFLARLYVSAREAEKEIFGGRILLPNMSASECDQN